MFFISKKRFKMEVEEQVNRRMSDREKEISVNQEFTRIYDRIISVERRVNRLENPPTGCKRAADCQSEGVLPY